MLAKPIQVLILLEPVSNVYGDPLRYLLTGQRWFRDVLDTAVEIADVPVEFADPARFIVGGSLLGVDIAVQKPDGAGSMGVDVIIVNERVERFTMPLGRGYFPQDPRYTTNILAAPELEADINRMARLLIRTFGRKQREALDAEWDRSAEVLICQLDELLRDKHALTEALLGVYGDLRAAEGQVELLQAQLASLKAEHRTKPEKWRNPMIIATIAVAVTTALGPVLGSLAETAFENPVKEIVEQSITLRNDCNVQVSHFPVPTEGKRHQLDRDGSDDG